jgi:hypothetical protein
VATVVSGAYSRVTPNRNEKHTVTSAAKKPIRLCERGFRTVCERQVEFKTFRQMLPPIRLIDAYPCVRMERRVSRPKKHILAVLAVMPLILVAHYFLH